jgi:hypothetical protein
MRDEMVSNLPDWHNWQWRWNGCDWRWVAANNSDDLIAIHFKSRMETNNNVVGEHTLWILLGSASFQWQLNFIAQVAFPNDLTSAVTVEVGVGDAVKLFVEFQIHLCGEKTHNFSDNLRAAKKELRS